MNYSTNKNILIKMNVEITCLGFATNKNSTAIIFWLKSIFGNIRLSEMRSLFGPILLKIQLNTDGIWELLMISWSRLRVIETRRVRFFLNTLKSVQLLMVTVIAPRKWYIGMNQCIATGTTNLVWYDMSRILWKTPPFCCWYVTHSVAEL